MNTKLKILLFLLFAILDIKTVKSQTLVVWQKDGGKAYFHLDEQPRSTFSTENLIITTAKDSIAYPLSTIRRYTYEGGSLGINDVSHHGVIISQRGSEIIVTGLPASKSAIVYSTDGKQLLAKQSNGTSSLVISLAKLPTGVYVIKADSVTYKFTKR